MAELRRTRPHDGRFRQNPCEGRGEFEAWDGYIRGKTLVLEPFQRIVQSWRTTEFAKEEKDSQIEVTFEKAGAGTKVTIHHTGLPPHGMEYKQGWVDNYFEPMKKYFEG